RLDHAQKALASAKIVSEDYVQDGQFLQSFMDVILDLDKLSASASASDLAGAKAVVATLKTHVDAATQQSTAPGLPTQMHALMVDFQTLTSDFGKLLDAAIAGDETGLTTYSDKLQADVTKLGTYNFDQMGSDVAAFYKPYIDTFNSEMSAATASAERFASARANQTSWAARRSTINARAGPPSLETANQPAARLTTTTPLCSQSPTNRPRTWRPAARRNFTRGPAAGPTSPPAGMRRRRRPRGRR